MEASRRISIPSTELTNISLAETKLPTRSPVLVRDVRGIVHGIVRGIVRGIRLRSETTILDHEVSCIGKHGHGGGMTDRRWEQKAVKFMSTREPRSQTNQP